MDMAEWITCPVLVPVGLQDDVYPPCTSFAPCNAVKSKKNIGFTRLRDTVSGGNIAGSKDEWMAKMLGIDNIGENQEISQELLLLA